MAFVLPRRLQPVNGLVDMVPAVTVVLLLLFFFVLSSSFVLQPGIKIEPPRSAFGVGTPLSRLIVAVTLAPQQFETNGVPLPRQPTLYFNDQIVTVEGFRAALDRLPAGRLAPSLVLKADRDVPLDLVTQIVDVAVAHRFPVVIATQPVSAP